MVPTYEAAEPGSDAFWREIWRLKPAVYRKLVPEDKLAPFQIDQVERLCRTGATARIFVLEGESRDRGVSRLIPEPNQAWRIYDAYRCSEKITILLNGAERVDARLIRLQDLFAIPFDWRRDDVVATVSGPGAGIGFHAGREDGFVVQVSGSRRWRVWSPDVVGDAHKRFLLGDDRIEPPMEPRPNVAPIVDCQLEPGDVLYTPAMFAHEGETIQESVSLSLAWRGVSAYHVLATLKDLSSEPLDFELERALMALIPDFLDPSSRASSMVDFLKRKFHALGDLRPCDRELEEHVECLARRARAS